MDDQSQEVSLLKESSFTSDEPMAIIDDNVTHTLFETGFMAACSKEPNALNLVRQWIDSLQDKTKEINYAYPEVGMSMLHLAALLKYYDLVCLMLEAGADPTLTDQSGVRRTVLHWACFESPASDLIIDKNPIPVVAHLIKYCKSIINVQDERKDTALHLAASDAKLEIVKILLDNGADIELRNNDGDTPFHNAARSGSLAIIKEMMERNPQCVKLLGKNDSIPLLAVVSEGHIDVAREILLANPDVNARAYGQGFETPLHSAAHSGQVLCAKLLIENGALVNPPPPEFAPTDYKYRSPFHFAAHLGKTDLAIYLLEKGALVTSHAFEEIIQDGYEYVLAQSVITRKPMRIAAKIVSSSQWPVALRRTYENRNKVTTPFRELIRKMPDVAVDVLNKCTVPDPSVSEPRDESYSVVYNYEFLEDFLDGEEPDECCDKGNEEENCGSQVASNKDETDVSFDSKRKEKETFGCSYAEIMSRPCNQSSRWGPPGFSKSNHPLAIMVRSKELGLLAHPVIGSLLHYKWKKFGQYGYFINLFTYFVFLISLTSFALLVPNPHEDLCQFTNLTNSSIDDGIGISRRNFLYLAPAVVILFAVCRLMLEVGQLITLRLYYLMDWVNWMEVSMFVCSIIFVWIYNTNGQCVLSWQWQVGVFAVFLGWIDLIIFISKFPLTGIYVLMFVKILYTFLKMLVLTVLLIIAFGLTFFMIFFDPGAQRSPFSGATRSLLKTMTMTTGELDFDAIFRLDPAGGSDDAMELEYLPISYILWILFIVLMPILLTNMLVGLAVGDIDAIQKDAHLQKLALQVEQVLTMEELLPRKWRRKLRTTFIEVYPNRQISSVSKFGFVVWGGDHYDSHKCISRALRPQKDPNEEILQKTNALVQEIHEVKQALQQNQILMEAIAKKNGIEHVEVSHNP